MTFQKDAEELKNRKPTHPKPWKWWQRDNLSNCITNKLSQPWMCIRPSYLALIKNESKNHNPPRICIHTQTPIVTVFIYIVCRFWVCIGTGLILTGRTNSSPERVFPGDIAFLVWVLKTCWTKYLNRDFKLGRKIYVYSQNFLDKFAD